MTKQTFVALNDGTSIPQIGLGVWQASPDEAAAAVKTAIEAGYRHIDTAAIYRNEKGVGQGISAAGIARSDLYITTKVWNSDQGFDATLAAAEASLKRLALDYVDVYLIHWPVPNKDLYLETWRALIRLKDEGRVRSIGVSNFQPDHLDRLVAESGVAPVLNQIELHPRFQQADVRAANAKHKVATQSWSPLGQGKLLADPVLATIAAKHGRTPAQIVIRWHIENGLIAIPKSVTPARIVENFDVFAFKLDNDDLAKIALLDSPDGRIGPRPEAVTS
jgi:2,5-diketo-D-gluconate reductase A